MALKRIALLILTTFYLQVSQAQENCQQVLDMANGEFEAGRFYGLPSMLKGCLESGFTKEQRFRAYYILAQAYLVLEDPIGAENSYLSLLKEDPEFKPNEKDDPIDIVYLSKKFTSRPRFTPHYRIGANVTFPGVIQGVSTSASPSIVMANTLRVGLQAGVGLDWNIDDNWSVCTGISYAVKSFGVTTSNIARSDVSTLIDRSSWLDIPIYLKYSYDSGKIRPFGYIGFAANLLVSSSASLVFNDNSSVSAQTRIAQGPDIDLGFKRNFFNRSIVFGGGVKYKIGKNFLYADARYMVGINNITIPDKNYYNSDGTLATTLTQYQYVSDFLRLDNLSISFGYIRPLYDPRKLKKGTGKNFFRGMFKSKKK
ncbi:MAG: PorT family protein [Cyclobacteriaceae bacterium]|nr:PorT family protein [Cyclobacteriaceae bacterium]